MTTWVSLPSANRATILSANTASAGTTFVPFADTPCSMLDLVNASAATVEYQRNGTGPSIQIPAGGSRLIIGISNANQVGIRRVDQSTTPVAISAEAFAV